MATYLCRNRVAVNEEVYYSKYLDVSDTVFGSGCPIYTLIQNERSMTYICNVGVIFVQ